jgi:hypothetical protein
MAKKYVEVVLGANKEYTKGFLHGYLLGKGLSLKYFFNHDAGIKAESLSEKIKEWTALSDKFQHLLVEQDLYVSIQALDATLEPNIKILSGHSVVIGEFSFKIKSASIEEVKEVKKAIAEKPSGLLMADWKEKEKADPDAKGVELYTPTHDYTFEGSGCVKGEIESLITFRQQLTAHSAVDAKEIRLQLAE